MIFQNGKASVSDRFQVTKIRFRLRNLFLKFGNKTKSFSAKSKLYGWCHNILFLLNSFLAQVLIWCYVILLRTLHFCMRSEPLVKKIFEPLSKGAFECINGFFCLRCQHSVFLTLGYKKMHFIPNQDCTAGDRWSFILKYFEREQLLLNSVHLDIPTQLTTV